MLVSKLRKGIKKSAHNNEAQNSHFYQKSKFNTYWSYYNIHSNNQLFKNSSNILLNFMSYRTKD